MDKKTKNEFISLFNQGFEEVVAPQLDRIEGSLDKLDHRLDKVEDRLESVDRKLDYISDKVLDTEVRVQS